MSSSASTVSVCTPTTNNGKHEASVNPSYYARYKFSAVDAIDEWGLDFYLGQVVKYVQRAGKKPTEPVLRDLMKARWYLERKIRLLEQAEADTMPMDVQVFHLRIPAEAPAAQDAKKPMAKKSPKKPAKPKASVWQITKPAQI